MVLGVLCMGSDILDRIFCDKIVVPLCFAHFFLVLLEFCSRFGSHCVTLGVCR